MRVYGRCHSFGLAGFTAAILIICLAPSSAWATKTRSHVRHARRHLVHRAADVNPYGELDCNGNSPVQRSIRATMNCTDIRSLPGADNANAWSGHFYDNGVYIGHDEPDMGFYSSLQGSGNDVSWTDQLPLDPTAAPTVKSPGSDVVHWFELSPAPWFSMMMCDPNSYPMNGCTPKNDSNAPTCTASQNCAGGGSAFMEMQLYPPGQPPFVDNPSCDDSHWCAALTIDSLECTLGFASCNNNCVEPVNFAFIQNNGVPAGPASPQNADLATFTPNAHTLLMNPGDTIRVHLFDAPVPGHRGTYAFKVVIDDLSTGQSGYMQASAANGFQNTSIADCSGTPFNFQPEYNTAAPANISPWAALQTDISTQFETGHFEPCTKLSQPFTVQLFPNFSDTTWNACSGPYERSARGGDGTSTPEVGDAYCFPAGDTHGGTSPPDSVTGCTANFFQNGDLDFDGTPYWADWPTTAIAPSAKFAGSFVQSLPTTGRGSQYPSYQIQTDVALSESTCSAGGPGCAVPPPNAPGAFYPYWSRVGTGTSCKLEFGNVAGGAVDGGVAQYGTDQFATLGYDEFMGPIKPNNSCT